MHMLNALGDYLLTGARRGEEIVTKWIRTLVDESSTERLEELLLNHD